MPVLHVLVFRQSDGNMAACVRVSSPADAQYAISKLQKVEIGFKRKRIYISYRSCSSSCPGASVQIPEPGGLHMGAQV